MFDSNDWSQGTRYAPEAPIPNDYFFGSQIAAEDEFVLIKAKNGVYVFDRDSGAELSILTQPAGSLVNEFAKSIAIHDGKAYLGSPDRSGAAIHGAVYVFDAATGTLEQTLTIESNAVHDRFGFKLQIDNDMLYVSAISVKANTNPNTATGTIYAFDIDTLDQLSTITTERTSQGNPLGEFGKIFTVSNGAWVSWAGISGCNGFTLSRVVFPSGLLGSAQCSPDDYGSHIVSSHGIAAISQFDYYARTNTVYVHDLSSDSPHVLIETIELPDINGYLGNARADSLAINKQHILVGLSSADDTTGFGRVLVYPTPCYRAFLQADITQDGELDVFDVFGFLDLWSAHDPEADLVPNGVWDVFDVFAYLEYFSEACE
jgi:hypothetical protein